VGQPGRGCGLTQRGQLTIGEELLGYDNNKLHTVSVNLLFNLFVI